MANDNTDRQRVLELQHNMPIEDVLRSHLETHRAERDMVDACCSDLGIGIGTFYRWTRQLDISVKAYHHLEPVNA
jgi:hypothetical protein